VREPLAGSRRGASIRNLLAGAAAAGLLVVSGARAAEPLRKAQTQTAPASSVRVFTNADLERYRRPVAERLAPPSAPPALAQPREPAAEAVAIPPEDRSQPVATPELRAREAELETLIAYLRAKEQWLKNPLLPPPTPPAGETLTDAVTAGGQQLDSTRMRAAQNETRLLRVRAMLQARGEH